MWYLINEGLKLINNDLDKSFNLPRKKFLIMHLLLKNRNEVVTYDNLMWIADVKSVGALRSHIRQLQAMGLPLVVKGGVIFDELGVFE